MSVYVDYLIEALQYKDRTHRQAVCLPLELSKRGGVVGHVSKHQPLLIVIFTQNLVVTKIKPVSHTEPIIITNI